MRRLLLLHGFGCDHRFWAPQEPALSAHELCAPDLPYHGGPTDSVAKTLEGLAAWVVREHLPRPAVLIGHSLGGMIALQIARERPELVEGLVLVDAFPSLELNAQYLDGLYAEPMAAELLTWIERTRAEIIARMTEATYEEIWPSVAQFDARPWLGEFTCPLLGIYGGRGRYGEQETERLKRDLLLDRWGGRATVSVVAGVGHFVNLERPDAVNATLLAWLDQARE
ncbi:MAG: alpha/beta hydrolase [Armatimonadota bacterium]